MNTNKLFYTLLILIALDFVISAIGIAFFGITEGNPLYNFLGFTNFFIVKLIATVIAIILLWYLQADNVKIGNVGLNVLCVLYSIVFINNIIILGCDVIG